jgi:hypothetical protein
MYDRDNSGQLSSFELRQALTSAGYQVNNHVLQSLVLRYGNKDGQILFDDYIMCTIKLKAMIGKLKISLNPFVVRVHAIECLFILYMNSP